MSESPRRQKLSRRRLSGYGCSLLVGLLVASSLERTVIDDMETVLAAARDSNGAAFTFHKRYASLVIFPRRGYSLTLDVADLKQVQPAFYFTITRLDGRVRGDLMFAEGEEGARVLEGADLEAFMKRAELSLTATDEVYARYYLNAAPTAKAPVVR